MSLRSLGTVMGIPDARYRWCGCYRSADDTAWHPSKGSLLCWVSGIRRSAGVPRAPWVHHNVLWQDTGHPCPPGDTMGTLHPSLPAATWHMSPWSGHPQDGTSSRLGRSCKHQWLCLSCWGSFIAWGTPCQTQGAAITGVLPFQVALGHSGTVPVPPPVSPPESPIRPLWTIWSEVIILLRQ